MLDLTTIGQTCSVGDGTHSKVPRQDSGVLYLTSRNFKDGSLDLSNVYYISEEDYERHFGGKSKALAKPETDDLVFSIIGTLGEPYLVRGTDRFGLSSSVAIVRPNQSVLDPRFLLYWSKGPVFQNALFGIKGGVAQGYVSLEMMRSLPAPRLSLPVQRRIAGILSAYDELIENSQRRIKILESMARALYREWFVHFRFPGHPEGVSAMDGANQKFPRVASSLGDIPQGWEVTDLAKVCTERNGIQTGPFGSQLHEADYSDEGVPVVMPKDLIGFRIRTDSIARIPEETADKLSRHRMQLGDIVYGRAATSVVARISCRIKSVGSAARAACASGQTRKL